MFYANNNQSSVYVPLLDKIVLVILDLLINYVFCVQIYHYNNGQLSIQDD